MEQLLSSLKSTYSSKILKKILGQDTLSFEYIAHENEILFYITCARNYMKLIEKQINGFYPDAVIEETKEVNIFEGRKYFATTYLYTKKPSFYPIKTYQKLESDPINNITNAFSKLDENSSAAIQIMLKPIDDDWQHKSTKVSSKMMQGKKSYFSLNPLHMLGVFFDIFFTSQGEKETPHENTSSALTQERAKTVDEKGDKTGYEAVIRIIATGEDQHSADAELKNIVSSFSQFSYPDFNKFSYTYRHSTQKLIKNYIYRYFKRPL